ncbi:NUDIX domain-containing protein (plasmid) [Pseudorhodobacter turbinis]|uniref:Putative gamma-glutamylcyclotransferase n=1 Tax=Pseudorhodobacter turbinis TaxID=2500533 RepID=A0A4P8ELS0_9RHOB|nr:NUDIX domain-containing protein [Pseudorhodobacter turbinis]
MEVLRPLFIYGTLCHLPLLEVVLGRMPAFQPAILPDHAVYWADGHDFPLVVAQAGGAAYGYLLTDLDDADLARLDYYEGPFGYGTQERLVEVDGQSVSALVYIPEPGLWHPADPWQLQDWVARWGQVIVATAEDMMALYPAEIPMDRRGTMVLRGAGRLRAAVPGAIGLRRPLAEREVQVQSRSQPYANFFAVEEYDLSFRRFDGTQSPVVKRAVFISVDAVTVLPYDPVLDRVLLVEQFRMGPFARGDIQPWQLEPIAGRIDVGETPEDAARREALEEADLTLGDLLPVSAYYPSPGAKIEYIYSYVALTGLPDGTAIIGGAQDEAEDIKGHLMSFEAFAALVARGEATSAPLLISYYWLERERARLRAQVRDVAS